MMRVGRFLIVCLYVLFSHVVDLSLSLSLSTDETAFVYDDSANNHYHNQQHRSLQRPTFTIKGKENLQQDDLYREGSIAVHVVFSTDCTPYQDWQTLVLFHSAKVVGQHGTVTRIASGCDEEKQKELTALYEKLYPDLPFRVYFVPDFSSDVKQRKYVYYNKSWGLRFFLLNNTQSSSPSSWFAFLQDTTAVIAVIDPDFIFIRPLTASVTAFEALPTYPAYVSLPDRVLPGHPIGQTYGHGVAWTNDHPKSEQENFHRKEVCGEGSPCLTVSPEHGMRHYTTGSPYIAVLSDMKKIAVTWSDFALKLFDYQAIHQSEMYAYSMATAHLHLPHAQYHHFMVSNLHMEEEGWKWVDALTDDEVCLSPSTMLSGKLKPLPTFLHYCQYYGIGELMLNKFVLHSREVLSCSSSSSSSKRSGSSSMMHRLHMHSSRISPSSPLSTVLYVDIPHYLQSTNANETMHYLMPLHSGGHRKGKRSASKQYDVIPLTTKQRKRMLFMLCILQRNIREALELYHKAVCSNS